jgi:hypothetical protein
MADNMADNWRLDITNAGIRRLRLAMEIAFSRCPGWKVTHYCDHTTLGLVLLWSTDEKVGGEPVLKLPSPLLNVEVATQFVWAWLEAAEHRTPPDFDGDVARGWRLYNESSGLVGHSQYAFVAVQPVWSLYGK